MTSEYVKLTKEEIEKLISLHSPREELAQEVKDSVLWAFKNRSKDDPINKVFEQSVITHKEFLKMLNIFKIGED